MKHRHLSHLELVRFQDDPQIKEEIILRFSEIVKYQEENHMNDEDLLKLIAGIYTPEYEENYREKELEQAYDDITQLEADVDRFNKENLRYKQKLLKIENILLE